MSGRLCSGSISTDCTFEVEGYLNDQVAPLCQISTGSSLIPDSPLASLTSTVTGIGIFFLFMIVMIAPCLGSSSTYLTPLTACSSFQLFINHDFQNQVRSSPATALMPLK